MGPAPASGYTRHLIIPTVAIGLEHSMKPFQEAPRMLP